MGEWSDIAWCHHTFNGWIGCQKISQACKHCYASVQTRTRVLRSRGIETFGPPETTVRARTSNAYWRKPFVWNRRAAETGERYRVFSASLSDVFEDHPMVRPWRADLWRMIEACRNLDWLLLTKRPENVPDMVPAAWMKDWPVHVWLGTTAEDPETADARIPYLLQVPTPVPFLSMEPLLALPDLARVRGGAWYDGEGADFYDALRGRAYWANGDHGRSGGPRVKWVIAGGGSGGEKRATDLAWLRKLRDDVRGAGAAFFLKQVGSQAVDSALYDVLGPSGKVHYTRPVDDGALADEARTRPGYSVRPHRLPLLNDRRAGADPGDWPVDLRVQEFPPSPAARAA